MQLNEMPNRQLRFSYSLQFIYYYLYLEIIYKNHFECLENVLQPLNSVRAETAQFRCCVCVLSVLHSMKITMWDIYCRIEKKQLQQHKPTVSKCGTMEFYQMKTNSSINYTLNKEFPNEESQFWAAEHFGIYRFSFWASSISFWVLFWY